MGPMQLRKPFPVSGSGAVQRLTDALGVLREHRLVGHLAGVQLERLALVAGNYVEMDVENGLPGRRLVELDDAHAVRLERLTDPARHVLRRLDKVGERARIDVE